jgi:hypothetical protein
MIPRRRDGIDKGDIDMLLDVLKKRFREAEYDGWQGYALLNLPDGEDPRDDCFKKMDETVDIIPTALRESAEQFLALNAAWFDITLKNLCEEVGWDFFPENATVFVEMLIGRLRESSPETCQNWRIEPEADKLNFCDPPNT